MLLDDVRRQIRQWERDLGLPLWLRDETLVVGVSGGPDSLAMLHMLARNGLHDARHLLVGHLDHGLRASSTNEARAVALLCENWGVDCVVKAMDVATVASEEKLSIEEAARLVRYEFLGDLARDAGCQRIVVGHTADDQAETILMHFVRGAGLDGLRGMGPISPLAGSPELFVVRPLLAVTRADVMEYCKTHELVPMFDPSNDDLTFFRNRLRHELLPLLESYNPQIRERLLRTAEVVRADVDYLDVQARKHLDSIMEGVAHDYLRLALEPWRQLPLSLRRRTLREAVWQLHQSLRDVSFAPIEQARYVAEHGDVGARSSLPGPLELVVGYDTILIREQTDSTELEGPQLVDKGVRSLAVPGLVKLNKGWQIRADASTRHAFRQHSQTPNRWREYIDADAAGSLIVRARRRGERMVPLGMHGNHAKLSDIMIDAKIPRTLRARWPVVANHAHPVWLVGLRIDDRVRIHAGTKRVIQLRCDHVGAAEEP